MNRFRALAAAMAAIALTVSCGSESPSSESVPDDDRAVTLPVVTRDVAPADAPPLPRAQTTELDQPAIWPASDVVLSTPEEAAAGFVADVLGVEPALGDFLGGDSRSGEIQVFSPGEPGGSADLLERGLLGVRMIGPNDGWFVIAATSAGQSIDSPNTLDRVPAGPLVVTGEGRGFEGTIVVRAFRAGDTPDVLDQAIAAGGAFEELAPYSVTLDLSGAEPGDVVSIIAVGDTGLEGDPGEFASLPVVIDEGLPATQ